VADPGFTCVQDAYDHLMKPENQISTELFVIKWDGLYPYLSRGRIKYLQEDRALAEVTYTEYLRRKRRPKDDPDEKEPGDE
jgi:hypothetical protein